MKAFVALEREKRDKLGWRGRREEERGARKSCKGNEKRGAREHRGVPVQKFGTHSAALGV